MKVIFSGGGTGGSVTPLIAIYQKMKKLDDKLEVLWIGQKEGVEKEMIEKYGITYKGISSGKLRRYFSWQNFIDPFKIFVGWWQSKKIIKEFKPDAILTAGSFVAVPVARAAKSKKVDLLVHQQDISIGLANKLMLPWARWINFTFKDLSFKLPANKEILYCGNPVREEILSGSKARLCSKYNFNPNKKILLILGGGTGALNLNKTIDKQVGDLVQSCQVLHLTGKGKNLRGFGSHLDNNYQVVEFLDANEMGDAFAAADLIVTRAGLSTLSELTVLGKAVVIVPLPGTHQEENAAYWTKRNAACLFEEKDFADFSKDILALINDDEELQYLSHNIRNLMPADAAEALARVILGK